MLLGAAMMANISAASSTDVSWAVRTKGLLDAAKTAVVYPGTNVTDVLFEAKCEEGLTCNVDQWSFKTYLARWMVETAQVQPRLVAEVMQFVEASAVGAAGCSGPGNACGTKWPYRSCLLATWWSRYCRHTLETQEEQQMMELL